MSRYKLIRVLRQSLLCQLLLSLGHVRRDTVGHVLANIAQEDASDDRAHTKSNTCQPDVLQALRVRPAATKRTCVFDLRWAFYEGQVNRIQRSETNTFTSVSAGTSTALRLQQKLSKRVSLYRPSP